MSRTFTELCAVVMINELSPRHKKFGYYPPVSFCKALCYSEFIGKIDRKTHRNLLNKYYENVEDLCAQAR